MNQSNKRKKPFIYAWSDHGDMYDQVFALNKGKYRRAQSYKEELGRQPDPKGRKYSFMPVITPTPELKKRFVLMHNSKKREILDSIHSQHIDVGTAKDDLRSKIVDSYSYFNPKKYYHHFRSGVDVALKATDSKEVSRQKKLYHSEQDTLKTYQEELTIHGKMKFNSMSEMHSAPGDRDKRKLHVIGHGGAGVGFLATKHKNYLTKQLTDLARDFKSTQTLSHFSDIRMESCWSANASSTNKFMSPNSYTPHATINMQHRTAPALQLHQALKKEVPHQSFSVRGYEGKGSQFQNAKGQKQRNFKAFQSVRQSTVARTFQSNQNY